MGQRAQPPTRRSTLRRGWHRRTSLRELTVFGAEARQLFCERFHVTVNFKRETTSNCRFPGAAGAPPDTHSLTRARFHNPIHTGVPPNRCRPNAPAHITPSTAEELCDLAPNCRVVIPCDELQGQHSVTFCDENRNPCTRIVVKSAFLAYVPRQTSPNAVGEPSQDADVAKAGLTGVVHHAHDRPAAVERGRERP